MGARSMMTSLRERRKQMLRDEILDAARALLAEKGYAAMAMDDLAAQVGISKPTLYSHFPTKDDIVVATAVREMEHFAALIEVGSDERTPLQRLIWVMRKLIQLHREKDHMELRPWTPEIFKLLCSREEALACMRRIEAGIIALIQAGITNGEIDPSLDPAIVASAFYALGNAMRFGRLSRGGVSNPAAADTLATIFERGVRGDT
jgi:AcrR family transcriptional regulator